MYQPTELIEAKDARSPSEMYQSSDLVDVGKAKNIILGILHWGQDPDGSSFPIEDEFGND